MKTRRFGALSAGLLMALLALLLTSCSYYGQAAVGQAEILLKRRSIDRLLDDSSLSDERRLRLATVREMRDFAVRELALPDNKSYRTFVDLGRPYAVWNVYAAPELSTTPLTWCFPVAGCVAYRGYFREERALRFARKLREKGYDVDVGGVRAYSTLGWFADPVLSTFLGDSDARLAGLLFHELAHQIAYAPGDTRFNESFATTVEIEGLRRWLAARTDGEEIMARHLREQERERQFLDLVLAGRDRLTAVYAEQITEEEKRRRKAEEMDRLREEYASLKESWGGDRLYDGFFAQDLNNAHLAVLGAYHDLVPAFQMLLAEHGEDLPAFYGAVRELAAVSDVVEREKRLLRYSEGRD